jgi:hypothetical protein
MKDKTPDEIHRALKNQVVRLDPHPRNSAIVCMRCEQVVITCIRSMPTAPQVWYSVSDTAYLTKASDAPRLAAGLVSFGCAVIGDAVPTASYPIEPSPMPRARVPWCGECDERTRMRSLPGPTLARCPRCHPLRAEPLAGHHEPEPMPDPSAYHAGVQAAREALRRARDDDEAHPF